MAELIPIPAPDLDKAWPEIGGQLGELARITGGRMMTSDLIHAIRERDIQLWSATDGSSTSLMTTQLLNFPRLKECRIIGAQGKNADRWLDLWPLFVEWAKANGCDVASMECRPGWKKLLAPLGFSETRIVLEKAL